MAAHSGTIGTETWADGDTMVGNVIENGGALTIPAGATIGVTGNYYLDVDNANAKILCNGTSGSGVVFESQDGSPAAGDWEFIRIISDADVGSVFTYTTINHANTALELRRSITTIDHVTVQSCAAEGIWLRATSGTDTISNYTFTSPTGYGIFVNATTGTAVINGCAITVAEAAHACVDMFTAAGAVTIERCIFKETAGAKQCHGVYGRSTITGGLTVTNCLAYGLANGFYTHANSTFFNCTAVACVNGFYTSAAITMDCTDCISWDCDVDVNENVGTLNYDYGTYSTTGGTPTITEHSITDDPLFKDAGSGDYDIPNTSPAYTTGTAAGAPPTDINGNTWWPAGVSMGAYRGDPPGGPPVGSMSLLGAGR